MAFTSPFHTKSNPGAGSGSGVTSVNSSDSSLTVAPITGPVDAIVDQSHNFNWTGQHTFNSHLPTSSQTPIAGNELVTKLYTDTFALGLQVRPSCIIATTVALPANLYLNGVAGVGATLTAVALGVLTIDGYAPVLNDRILVKNEAAQLANGIYTLTTVGTAGVAYVLTRAIDYDQAAEVVLGTFTSITMGIVNSSTQWVMDNPAVITMGVTAITFSKLSSNIGNVTGTPPSADNAIARYDGVTGLIIQNSDLKISDVGGGIVDLDTTTAELHINVKGNGNYLILTTADTTAGSSGGIQILVGAAFGGGQGGPFAGVAGTGGATGIGGPASVQGGQGGATSGRGGHSSLRGGNADPFGLNSNGGDTIVVPGRNSGTGTKGIMRFYDVDGANWSGNFDMSAIAAGVADITFSWQVLSGTVALLQNNLSSFAATTSAQLASIITNETGTGVLVFNNTPTFITPVIGAATGTSLAVTGAITTSSGAGAGVGYATGAGGSVTQITSKATAVTLNKISGRITMNNASLANNAEVSFTMNNTTIAATDVIIINMQAVGTIGGYTFNVSRVAAGSCVISLSNVSGGALAEAIVLNFAVIKSVIV